MRSDDTPAIGATVSVHLVDGTPDGIWVIDKDNWTGQGISFARSEINRACGREELDRCGVYLLSGESNDGYLPRLYVGEADNLSVRLTEQNRTKEFWTRALAFSSKDGSLNKAHSLSVEARLFGIASDAKRSQLENRQTPKIPSLDQRSEAFSEAFLREMLSILPVLGISVFELVAPEPDAAELFIAGPSAEGRGADTAQGFVVREGSRARQELAPSTPNRIEALRSELVRVGVLTQTGDQLVFAQDYIFTSSSAAADVVLGRSASGPREWKDESGVTLKELQAQGSA